MCKDNISRYNYAFWEGGVLELWKNSNITKLSFRVRNFNTVMFITDSNPVYITKVICFITEVRVDKKLPNASKDLRVVCSHP